MAKKSRKRLGRYEKNQSGCMWSNLINIFDFRQGRSTQKQLLDRKRGSKRIFGSAHPDIKLELLGDTCEISKEINDPVQSEMPTIDASKLSVKELMEEEMSGVLDHRKHEYIADGDRKQVAVDGSRGKRNRRRARSKASLDLDACGFVATHGMVSEKPTHRKHKSLSSVDLSVMVEECCTQIYQKDISCLKHGQGSELATQPIDDPSVIEERLWEAIKTLMNHFAGGKNYVKDRQVQPSKELMDALQILDTNKEKFLKFLQDPNSQLAKHIQNLQDIQVEDGKFKVLIASYLLEQDISNVKQQGSFWRRFKSPERTSSRRHGSFDDLSRIVVLKPGPPGSKHLDIDTPCSSLPGSPQSMKDKAQSEQGSSAFSFSEFKRKLKHAMRKEQDRVDHDGISYQHVDDQPSRDKKVGGENVGIASPSRDHFFIEKLPRFSVGIKKADKAGKLKEGKMHQEPGVSVSPDQRISNIYAEARKYLAEIVSNGDLDMGTPGRQVPKPLGKIISYPGYSSPSISSPRKQEEMRLSIDEECRIDDKTCQVVEENNVSLPDEVKQETENEPCMTTNELIHGAEVSTFELDIADELHCEIIVDTAIDEPQVSISEVDEDIIKSPHEKLQKECNQVENSSKSSPLQSTNEQDTYDRNESTCSAASSLICSMTEKNEDVDVMSDITSRPSPISVLEPIFDEDDISPSSIKSLKAVQPMQPRQLHFEDELAQHPGYICYDRTHTEGEKYTFEFVKAVVQMSGLTWDELLMRFLFSDHLIDPSLIDEVDFLPDLLSCDFNLLFDLINEVLLETSYLNFGCMLSFTKSSIKPESKGKDIFSEIWKGVEWHLKLERSSRTLDQIVTKDLAKTGTWIDMQADSDCLGILIQEAILNDLIEDNVLSCSTGNLEGELPIFLPVEEKEKEINLTDI